MQLSLLSIHKAKLYKFVHFMKKNFQTFTAELQSEQVQTRPQKFAPTLALKWCPQHLIGRGKLFNISAANQNQGAKCTLSARNSRLARKKACFTEDSLSFGLAY